MNEMKRKISSSRLRKLTNQVKSKLNRKRRSSQRRFKKSRTNLVTKARRRMIKPNRPKIRRYRRDSKDTIKLKKWLQMFNKKLGKSMTNPKKKLIKLNKGLKR
jgi:hypothetical protein